MSDKASTATQCMVSGTVSATNAASQQLRLTYITCSAGLRHSPRHINRLRHSRLGKGVGSNRGPGLSKLLCNRQDGDWQCILPPTPEHGSAPQPRATTLGI
ncbi:hypothetical protein ABBQ38_000500 [Trebouxia sp. C0009 RCD-2024]